VKTPANTDPKSVTSTPMLERAQYNPERIIAG
jgi:hypothetical protein